jgi:hypothetical protein
LPSFVLHCSRKYDRLLSITFVFKKLPRSSATHALHSHAHGHCTHTRVHRAAGD